MTRGTYLARVTARGRETERQRERAVWMRAGGRTDLEERGTSGGRAGRGCLGWAVPAATPWRVAARRASDRARTGQGARAPMRNTGVGAGLRGGVVDGNQQRDAPTVPMPDDVHMVP